MSGMLAAHRIPSLLYYAGSYGLLKEVAARLRLITPGEPVPEALWQKNSTVRRYAKEAAEDEEKARRRGEQAFPDASFPDASFPVISFPGPPFPRDFLFADDPLLRLRALLPDWPEPGYTRDRIHLDAGEQLAAGLLLARSDRYDLLGQVVEAGDRALLDAVRPAFEASVREGNVRALREALVHDRRRRDHLFSTYAAEPDPEPDQRWITIDWEAVRRAVDADSEPLRRQAAGLASHPQCPLDIRLLLATKWSDQFVWSRLLSDRPTGLRLLRTLPMQPNRSLAVPLSYVSEDGVGVSDILETAHPADLVLRDAAGLPGIVRRHPMQCVITRQDEQGPMRLLRGITELADHHLGDDPGAWTIGCRIVEGSRFTGSVAELLERAGARRPR
ncbi:hypothetical protein B7P34_05380 [Streptosporangium nondiastaticum]|uniref:Uncharacterized protein n=2 Tax=Streptosporangium nondiastaticum TaxID=35764 RepID=A0A9X7JU08_9ACTN|nr:hypothetical protein B7P34_05380 [Streptosporangium nondiastaticum]